MKEIFKAHYKCEKCDTTYTRMTQMSNQRCPCPRGGCFKVNNPYAEVNKIINKECSNCLTLKFQSNFVKKNIFEFIIAGNDVHSG